ncbi:unnamed protein product [Rotaria magnacalcarata]|uniref:Uncharacterized protein n=1 Tax=Rotaria magnacalcarata TaxID=392030 RepID=A0A817APQ1_9BILA|nr:unnamed protein product [Rotaria magnacalcarata]CAF3795051.1 unnamed protein product [Rotaria magnacalcarata]
MSTLIANRAQSAYPRPSYQAESDNQDLNIKRRPTTSVNPHQPFTNIFEQAALRTLGSATLTPPASRQRQRPKTANIATARTITRPASRKLRTNEVENLLRSLERDDAFIVQVDCLADYRTLVETIDLRRTPLDCQLLCALQQRENCIVQRNACRDTRFRSLLDILERPHVARADEQVQPTDDNQSSLLDYPPSDFPYEYIK